MMKLISFILLLINASILHSQCGVNLNSNLGYAVDVVIEPTSINNISWNSPNCTNGYTFSVELNIDVSFSGNNIPSQISTLRGVLHCNNNNSTHSFNIPNQITNNHIETTNGEWRGVSDCSSATPKSLGCEKADIIIDFDGSSEQTINVPCNIALPVELLDFDAHKTNSQSISLEWETASEKNSAYFIVEKTTDLNEWIEIGRVNSVGNSNALSMYKFEDKSPEKGDNYYRINQVDIDGKTTSYQPIVIAFEKDNNIKIYPTKSSNSIYIEGINNNNQEIFIYNNQGVNVNTNISMNNLNSSKKELDIQNIDQGIYFIKIDNQTYKFIKI